ncbi:hypothetical protein AALO_G00149700 [Alosa alosa]|uniref:Uncharacterized protein n=1 Tax=Alosa alosa TaxID=278164 RepID=A0AAV6GHD0_9TELE|nr:hypothetical protein AALO_G00149700 [Alosa alosa]
MGTDKKQHLTPIHPTTLVLGDSACSRIFDCNRWSSTSSDKPAVKARRQCSAPLIFQILPSLQLQHSVPSRPSTQDPSKSKISQISSCRMHRYFGQVLSTVVTTLLYYEHC